MMDNFREIEEARWSARRARLTMLLDDTHAVMTRAEFEALDDYSCTVPTGNFVGKIWRRGEPYRGPARWFLGEYWDDGTPGMIALRWREILIAS